MALLITSLTMLHFTPRDKLWHVYSPADFQRRADEGRIIHPRPEAGVKLLEVPLVPLGTQFPILRELTQPLSQSSRRLLRQISEYHRVCCHEVIDQLTPRELETLRGFAAGLTPQEVADEMVITLSTVNTYRKKIFELCRVTWTDRLTMRYHHLRDLFGPYFEQRKPYGKHHL